MTPPCLPCPIHCAGVDKSCGVCMKCEARHAYAVAVAQGVESAYIPPLPAGATDAAAKALLDEYRSRPNPRGGAHHNNRRKHIGPYRKLSPRARRLEIINRRIKLGLSQEQLADKVYLTQRTVSKLENGGNIRVRFGVRVAMERLFDAPFEELMALYEVKTKTIRME